MSESIFAISPLITVVITSFLGSLHCVGMCGSFVGVYCMSSSAVGDGRSNIAPHVYYNFGRLCSYLVLGAIAGVLGGGLEQLGTTIVGSPQAISILCGGVIIAWGIGQILTYWGVTFHRSNALIRMTSSALSQALRIGERLPKQLFPFFVGSTSVLLPCGWLYLYVVAAAGTGSLYGGILLMFAFWLGTVPAMFAVGLGLQRIGIRVSKYLPLATGVLMIVLGIFAVSGKLDPSILPGDHSQHHHHHH